MLYAQWLLTLGTLGYSLIPAIADTNKTHATNPSWVGHARFHVVWQVASYVGVAIVALVLIWKPGATLYERVWIAAALAVATYAGFFCAVFTKHLYGGTNYDKNGVLPIRAPMTGGKIQLEVNITIFTITSMFVLAGLVCLIEAR